MRRTALLLAALAAASPAPPLRAQATVAEPASAADVEKLRAEIEALRAEVGRLRQGDADTARLAELERKIDALVREIERLRAGEAPVEATEPRPGLGPAASKVYAVKHGVSLGGYGEMTYRNVEGDAEVDLLRAVLYVGYKFTDTILLNSEIELEHASTGEDGEVSAEFAYLDYLWRDEAALRAGLVLLPMGFLNELHEPTTYLGSFRPLTETQIIPSTWREIGAGVTGSRGSLAWRAYVVNGFDATGFRPGGLRGGRQKGSRALADRFAFAGRLDYEPRLGTLVGGSFYGGNSAQREDGFDAATTIFEVHGQWRERGFDVRALYSRATVGDVPELDAAIGLEEASVAEVLEGGYVQVGYDVLARAEARGHRLTPYLRWERFLPQSEVPEGFARDESLNRDLWTIGAAWQPIDQVVVKSDWTNVDPDAGEGTEEFRIQLGFIF